ncbi:glycosyltransferase [Luxibacter massiliensis]|uniref:glycosyltransferase n=1 Tax=Luxibacter massiliensis TaxID=2219695 RepID=UPI000F060E15|nr:glycosyltransferase [Luxibacter massiliensis]
MKIAMLTNNYKPFIGGVPVSVERQAKELVCLGHDVAVFAPDYGGDSREEGIGINYSNPEEAQPRVVRYRTGSHRMENGMIFPRLILWEILDCFKKERFDCIHVHHPMFTGPVALYLGKKYHLPVIYTYHTRYEDYLHYLRPFRERDTGASQGRSEGTGCGWRSISSKICRGWTDMARKRLVPWYMRWFTNQCDLILSPSAGMADRIKKNGTKTRTAVFPTGLEDSFFIKEEEKIKELRERFGSRCQYLFCTVSRLEEEKNPDFLLKGIACLKEKIGGVFRVLFIGEGSMHSQLEKMAGDLGISKEVLFMGNVDNQELKNYLAACDLFLFASTSETQGIVLAEALASGVPVVAVQGTGVEDIIVDGKNGYATRENVEEWTEKILEAIEENNHKKLKIQAEATASGLHSSRLALYEELLYTQCISEKEKVGTEYESEKNRTVRFDEFIQGIFKAS